MTLIEQRNEVERAAIAVFGKRVGQVIVGPDVVAVFPVKGEVRGGMLSPLVMIQHAGLCVPAALAALRIMTVAEAEPEPEEPAEPARPLVEEHP